MTDSQDPVGARVAGPGDDEAIDGLAAMARAETLDQRGGELLVTFDRAEVGPIRPKSPDELVVVGTVDGVVVGLGRVRVRERGSRTIAVIEELYVHPDGRGIGVAAAMLRELRAWAVDRKCSHLESQVLPGARASKNFFERVGMVTRKMIVSTALGEP